MGLSKAESERIFPGHSDMAHRMRSFDWSRNALGNPEDWPQSLKTIVRIILTSRQPMFVWWGKDLIHLYNDGYVGILGGKHPAALAIPAPVVWAEVWDVAGPRVEFAMSRDEGTYDEALPFIMTRNGYPEETYVTFSYSPIPDDTGGFGGILCPAAEDTQRIVGERQLALLRELPARTADARTWKDVCRLSVKAMETNPNDLPFALIYAIDRKERSASLAALTGLRSPHKAAPEIVMLDRTELWPLGEAYDNRRACLVSDLTAVSDELPVVLGHRVQRAIVLPIALSAEAGTHALLVAGLNPLRSLDDNYRGFLEMVAAAVLAAMVNAESYEAERRRAEALAELDRAKTAFFSNVSHEFRTPLTLMLGPLEDELRENPQASERLRIAHRNSLRLLKLVNALLDFARIEAGRAKAVYEPTDLSSLTADVASHFRSAIERAGLQFTVDCPALDEPVYIDGEMWDKIVLNLLSNAFKFTFEGGITVRLETTGNRHADLTVSDTGIGIPENEVPHVFERFHRVEAAGGRTYEGTGIGLALVKELVQLHGGSITVESTLGKGSTFKVTVPFGKDHLPPEQVGGSRQLTSTATRAEAFVEEALRWLPEEEASRQKLAVPAAKSEAAWTTRGADEQTARVLVVDDNADMRDHLRRLLADRYHVSAAANGEEAFQLALTDSPDVIVADVMMPKVDGFGLLQKLRFDSRTKTTSVILLSARAGDEARSEGIAAGADDYLVKPFSARELLARVAARIRKAEAEQQVRARLEQEVASRTAELQLRIAERDALLKEVHHRVKNNLLVINSMLEMQARRTGDFAAFRQLEEASNRVLSIARIHELLYQSGSFAVVDLASYAGRLVPQLVAFYNVQDRIEVTVHSETVTLDLERAVPCGLLLNELVSNTCKHAFPEGSRGRLTVRLAQEDGRIRLTVEDNGVGLPSDFESEHSDSLGLTIVRLLTDQLGGSITVRNGAGTCTEVQFPASK